MINILANEKNYQVVKKAKQLTTVLDEADPHRADCHVFFEANTDVS